VYGSPPFDEPCLAWQRAIHSKGAFNILCDGPYDEEIDTILREVDLARRTKLTQDLGQKLYDDNRGVMLGVRSIVWALSKKVAEWQTLTYVPLENNYEYVTASGS
jgi:ABC-type transport system substrate-binding protein